MSVSCVRELLDNSPNASLATCRAALGAVGDCSCDCRAGALAARGDLPVAERSSGDEVVHLRVAGELGEDMRRGVDRRVVPAVACVERAAGEEALALLGDHPVEETVVEDHDALVLVVGGEAARAGRRRDERRVGALPVVAGVCERGTGEEGDSRCLARAAELGDEAQLAVREHGDAHLVAHGRHGYDSHERVCWIKASAVCEEREKESGEMSLEMTTR